MAEPSPRTESTEGERHSLPVLMPAQADQPESWPTRVMRALFGWRAPSPRADLELVLTAEPAQSDFSPEEAAMLKNILGLRETRIERIMVPRADIVAVQQDITWANSSKFSKWRRIHGWWSTTIRWMIPRAWSIFAI